MVESNGPRYAGDALPLSTAHSGGLSPPFTLQPARIFSRATRYDQQGNSNAVTNDRTLFQPDSPITARCAVRGAVLRSVFSVALTSLATVNIADRAACAARTGKVHAFMQMIAVGPGVDRAYILISTRHRWPGSTLVSLDLPPWGPGSACAV